MLGWKIISYIIEMSPIENKSHHFCHFLKGYCLIVFMKNSLCKIRDNELYSRISPIANKCQRLPALL